MLKRILTTCTVWIAFEVLLFVMPLGDQIEAQQDIIPIDLVPWEVESYPFVTGSGFSPAHWTVAQDGLSVSQSANGQPTLFYSDFQAFNTDVRASVTVSPNWDNDYVGFALGFQSGDTSNPNAEYLLIDWKQATQYFDFGPPSDTPGSTARQGLAVSRVFGVPTADEFWGHRNFDHPSSDLNNGVEELARGTNLGHTGWEYDREYVFRFEFNETSLKVYVDDVLEIDIAGTFHNGRFAFYDFSQENVRYSAFRLVPMATPTVTLTPTFTLTPIPTPTDTATPTSVPTATALPMATPPPNEIPEPLTFLLMGGGLAVLAVYLRHRRSTAG